MSAPMIFRNISLSVGTSRLLDDFSLTIAPGEIVTLMGPSGSGKSSLIAYAIGALDPGFSARGSVEAGGRDVTGLPTEKRRIGVLFQDDLLFAHMSVGQNLAFALPAGISRAERRERVADALSQAELEGYGDRSPATLSGGQRSRIALLRALLAEPRAMLLDEPFSKLDSGLRQRIRQFTAETVARAGIPALLVTHDREDILGRMVEL